MHIKVLLGAEIAQSVLSDYGLGDRGSILGRGERIFPLTSVPRLALGPTQPPVKWVPGFLSLGPKRGRGVTLTTHPHLVPRSRMSRSYTSYPPQAPPWRAVGLLYFTLLKYYHYNKVNKLYLHTLYFRIILHSGQELKYLT
jgi:hypothetical protein